MARSFALASLVVAAEAFTSAPSTTLLSTSTNAPSRNGQRAGLLSLRAVGNRPDPSKMGNPVATSTSAGFTPRRMGTGTLTRQSATSSPQPKSAKKSVTDLPEAFLRGKKVLIRCDLNVPLDGKTITDDTSKLETTATSWKRIRKKRHLTLPAQDCNAAKQQLFLLIALARAKMLSTGGSFCQHGYVMPV